MLRCNLPAKHPGNRETGDYFGVACPIDAYLGLPFVRRTISVFTLQSRPAAMPDQTFRPGGKSMSTSSQVRRIGVPDICARKGGEPIVSLTAYTAPIATVLDPLVDFLLVGDSLGMVLYGFESTLPVTLDMMISHGAAVVRGSERACIAVDMPLSSYEAGPAAAIASAARRLTETGGAAVKREGGGARAETIAFLVARGIPVLAHIGLTPQSANVFGGFRVQGREDARAQQIRDDAQVVAAAGAF